jgi:hypothetical protein
MFEGWHDFYLVLGPSAAALIGLLFIVVTLTSGLDRRRAERGAQVFMTPIVFHLGVLVLLSALALFPRMGALPMGAAATVCGFLGLAYAAYVALAFITKSVESYEGDLWNYGLAVGILYVGMLVAGVLLLLRQARGPYVLAVDQVALFLLMVHNAWDLVVFITPRKDDPPPAPPPQGEA